MKTFRILFAVLAFVVSTQASACVFCDYFPSSVSEDSTLNYGTVVSVEPVDMNQVDYTLLNDHGMGHAGAAVSGGSLTGAILGTVVGVVADAVVHKSTKVIDGYIVTIALDNGEKMVVARPKNEVKGRGYDSVDDRVWVVVGPKMTLIEGSKITKEEAPAMIARRAPHQLKKPADSEAKATPAVATPEKQEAAPKAEENKQVSAN